MGTLIILAGAFWIVANVRSERRIARVRAEETARTLEYLRGAS